VKSAVRKRRRWHLGVICRYIDYRLLKAKPTHRIRWSSEAAKSRLEAVKFRFYGGNAETGYEALASAKSADLIISKGWQSAGTNLRQASQVALPAQQRHQWISSGY
jgi:hypothetical protein